MKVVWVIRPAVGGILEHLNRLLRGLQPDYEVIICGPASLRDWANGFTFYPVEICDGIHPLKDLRAMMKLTTYLKKENPQLVHMHGLKSVMITVPAARISKGQWRLIFTAHNCLPGKNSRWYGITHGRVQTRILRYLDQIISVSEYVRSQILEVVPEQRIETIYNGISSEDFVGHSKQEAREKLGVQGGDFVVGVIARLIPEKGLVTMLKTAALLLKINPAIKFVVIGDGPARAQLESYRTALNLQTTVRFMGHRTDVPQLLSGMDMFMLPSFSEGFSVSVLEAMAAKLPVVVSDLPSMREMITPGKGGYFVAVDDSPGFAAAILQIYKDKLRAYSMGEYNHRRVTKLYSTEKMVASTKKLYHELLTKEYLW